MNLFDFLKALGVALLLMVLNVAVAFGVVWFYGTFIEPGHDEAFYQAAAQRIAPWSSAVAGGLLFFGAAWLFGARKPTRPALMFALTFTVIYTVIDLSIIIAAGAIGYVEAISVAAKFAGAFLGARMVKRG